MMNHQIEKSFSPAKESKNMKEIYNEQGIEDNN
jgi:hypothetical protein